MISINISDVISILSSCRNYFIALGVIIAVAAIVMFIFRKCERTLRKLIRHEAVIAIIIAIVVIVNMICFGPMSTLLTLATGESGTISDEITKQSNEDCKRIAREGIVMLENDNLLPLSKNTKLNVFGWASQNPCYGGSGAGALNDLYPKTTLLEGLENAGFTLNKELSDLYEAYGLKRAAQGYGTDWNLPEPTVDSYTDTILGNAKDFSDTALIVLARTGGEGSDLPTDMSTANYTNNSIQYDDFEEGESYLELSRTEENMIDMVCKNFENVVLVYNGLTTMELGFIEDYPQIKGALWCAGPGQTGFDALGEILNGEVNPSAKTTDTFVYDLKSSPSWNNFGDFAYINMSEFAVDKSDPYMGGAVPTFVNYSEGIYVGYRFYETAAIEGLIDYDKTVQYPFGYGLSYTAFESKLQNIKCNDKIVTFDVTVRNTGDTAGKETVEIYYNPPYTNGGIEKAASNLIAFDKTAILEPNAEETLSFTINAEDFASYDASKSRCYVLEAGVYEISLNSDSHTKLDSFTYNVDKEIVYSEKNARSTDRVSAKNIFDYANGNVTYLSRAEHFANYEKATAKPESLTMPNELKQSFVNTSNYKMVKDENAQMPVTGADNGLQLKELRGKEYDDPMWDSLLDQLTVEEMNDMVAHGGFQTAQAASVGKIATVDCDGPSAVSNNFTGAGSVGFPSNTMIACTWNEDLANIYGQDMGKMAASLDASGWYAPSANLHRSAFGGRNYEYCSEDSLLAGKICANALEGAANEGVYGYIKHYALNEQETNRWAMICTWVDEQTIREIYLKPFEICVKEGNATAVMSSFNYIGGVWAGGNKELLTTILKDEWGFKGFIDTDYFAGAYYMNADQMLEAGGATCLSTFDIGTNYVSDTTDPTSLQHMRRATHEIMYTVVNSRAYEADNINPGMENWKKAAIAIDIIIGLALILLEITVIKSYGISKKIL